MKRSGDLPSNPIIVVKRKNSANSYSSSGSWKIAYADFITSMMAFFLFMWLINVTDDKGKAAIADYFNPIKLVKDTSIEKGLHDPHLSLDSDTNVSKNNKNKILNKTSNTPNDINANITPQKFEEAAMLQDPFYTIDKLSNSTSVENNKSLSSADIGEDSVQGAFLFGNNSHDNNKEVDQFINNLYQTSLQDNINKSESLKKHDKTNEEKNINRQSTDLNNESVSKANKNIASEATSQIDKASKPTYKIAEKLKYLFAKNKDLSSPEIEIKSDKPGLRIVLSDNKDFGLFKIGSSKPNKKTVELLNNIAKTLNNKHIKIIINGHTDARQYRSHSYDNWQLSTSRAQMTYYMLVRGGLDKRLVDHIGGYADSALKNPSDPYGAENRRIEILVIPNESIPKSSGDINFENL